jgi:hypothetical protein
MRDEERVFQFKPVRPDALRRGGASSLASEVVKSVDRFVTLS